MAIISTDSEFAIEYIELAAIINDENINEGHIRHFVANYQSQEHYNAIQQIQNYNNTIDVYFWLIEESIDLVVDNDIIATAASILGFDGVKNVFKKEYDDSNLIEVHSMGVEYSKTLPSDVSLSKTEVQMANPNYSYDSFDLIVSEGYISSLTPYMDFLNLYVKTNSDFEEKLNTNISFTITYSGIAMRHDAVKLGLTTYQII